MPKTRRRSFERAHAFLMELRQHHAASRDGVQASPHQLQPLRSLQCLLIKEISRAERKIRRSKAILKTLKEAAHHRSEAELEERIEFYRYLAFIWRCFGDAIAFMFMDKFALKQTYFNTHNLNVKQDAGFLGDKAGLAGELEILDRLLELGVPAVLTDLTNTMRHGDVCAMIGPDPFLIEVKLGKLDKRGRRQRDSIRQLSEFFDKDEVEGLRGLEKVRRVSHQGEEVFYIEEINDCIVAAIKNGASWRCPEDGLYYAVFADGDITVDDVLAELNLERSPMVFLLNEAKAARAWSPYSPFILSILDKENLFRFIWGDIYIAVFYEFDALKETAEAAGFKFVSFSEDESDFAFELSRPSQDGQMRVAKQMFARIAFDFTSPRWLLQSSIEGFESHASDSGS